MISYGIFYDFIEEFMLKADPVTDIQNIKDSFDRVNLPLLKVVLQLRFQLFNHPPNILLGFPAVRQVRKKL
jgi:hypothetical protein